MHFKMSEARFWRLILNPIRFHNFPVNKGLEIGAEYVDAQGLL